MRQTVGACRDVVSITFRAWPLGSFVYPAMLIGSSLAGVVGPIALKGIVDGLTGGETRAAAVWGAVYLVTMLGPSATGCMSDFIDVWGVRTEHGIRKRLMCAALSAPGLEHLESPDYADRIQVVEQQSDAAMIAFSNLGGFLAVVGSLLVALVVLVTVDPLLAPVCLGAIVAGALQAQAVRRELNFAQRSAPGQRLAHRIFRLATAPPGAKELRMLGTLPYLIGEHERVTDEVIREIRRGRLAHVRAGSLAGLAQGLLLAGAVGLLAYRASTGQATVGDVVMVVGLLMTVSSASAGVGASFGRVAQFVQVAERLLWLLDYRSPVEVPDNPIDAPGRIEDGITFEGVSFVYPGTSETVLHDLTFHLPAGTTVAFVGENGAGKTTLVKLLSRLYDPTEGRIVVDGTDLRQFHPEEWRTCMTAAFQDFARPHFLVRESVGIGDVGHIDDDDAVAAAARMGGAEKVVESLPQRYDTQLGRQRPDGVELSEGQWQKLAIARSCMREAPLVRILDEPTAALDPRAEHEVFETFRSTRAAQDGQITLLISHRFSTVRMADHIIVLDKGRIVESGSHDELLRNGGVYADLYTLQARAYQ